MGPELEGPHEAGLIGDAREHDHHRAVFPSPIGPGLMGRQDLEPRHVGKSQVTEDRIEMLPIQCVEQLSTPGISAHLPALYVEQRAELICELLVVFQHSKLSEHPPLLTNFLKRSQG